MSIEYACGLCPDGMVGDGVHCSQTDPCESNPCYPGATCTMVVNFPASTDYNLETTTQYSSMCKILRQLFCFKHSCKQNCMTKILVIVHLTYHYQLVFQTMNVVLVHMDSQVMVKEMDVGFHIILVNQIHVFREFLVEKWVPMTLNVAHVQKECQETEYYAQASKI